MSKLPSLDTIIVTILIFASFSSLLRVILEYFWTYFGVCFSFSEYGLIFSHEILYRCFWYYSDGHDTENNFSCDILLCWGSFWHIFGPILVCDLLFLENRSIFFHEISYRFLKVLWPLFYGLGSTASRLQSHYEETVYLSPLSPQKILVLVLP